MEALTISAGLFGRLLSDDTIVRSNIGHKHPLFDLDGYLDSGIAVHSDFVENNTISICFLVTASGLDTFTRIMAPILTAPNSSGVELSLCLKRTNIRVRGKPQLLWHLQGTYLSELARQRSGGTLRFVENLRRLIEMQFILLMLEKTYHHHVAFFDNLLIRDLLEKAHLEMVEVMCDLDGDHLPSYTGLVEARTREALLSQIHEYFMSALQVTPSAVDGDLAADALISLLRP